MLTTGVTLPCVDILLLLDDLKSTDLNYQKMFRCFTESVGKRAGFVVDLNPTRIIKTLYQYGIENGCWIILLGIHSIKLSKLNCSD